MPEQGDRITKLVSDDTAPAYGNPDYANDPNITPWVLEPETLTIVESPEEKTQKHITTLIQTCIDNAKTQYPNFTQLDHPSNLNPTTGRFFVYTTQHPTGELTRALPIVTGWKNGFAPITAVVDFKGNLYPIDVDLDDGSQTLHLASEPTDKGTITYLFPQVADLVNVHGYSGRDVTQDPVPSSLNYLHIENGHADPQLEVLSFVETPHSYYLSGSGTNKSSLEPMIVDYNNRDLPPGAEVESQYPFEKMQEYLQTASTDANNVVSPLYVWS